MRHHCPAPGCRTEVDDRLFCCREDWFALSLAARSWHQPDGYDGAAERSSTRGDPTLHGRVEGTRRVKGFACGAAIGVALFGLWAQWYLGDAVRHYAPITRERAW